MDSIKDALIALVSGSVGAAIIKLVADRFAWNRERKAAKEDRAEQKKADAEKRDAMDIEKRLRNIEEQNRAQNEALRFILYDRIRHFGQAYIAAGEVDFDDRRILNDMHSSYHNGLGGNGDFDVLMREVNALPLKPKGKK